MSLPANQPGDEPAPPARTAPNPRRMPARFCRAGLLVVVLITVGPLAACAIDSSVSGGSNTVSRLQQAGYDNVAVSLESGSGIASDGLVDISYSAGPAGSAEIDARNAERVVWDTLRYRFGVLAVTSTSGGCTSGAFCVSFSTQTGRQTYTQLRAEFGPRPVGLDKTSVSRAVAVPPWLPGLINLCGLAVVITIVTAVIRARARYR